MNKYYRFGYQGCFFILFFLFLFGCLVSLSTQEVTPFKNVASKSGALSETVLPPGVPEEFWDSVSPYLTHLSRNNFIHGVIYYETILLDIPFNHPKVKRAYKVTENLIDDFLKSYSQKTGKKAPEEMLFDFYKIILSYDFEQRGFPDDKGVDYFLDALSSGQIDCDTGSYLYLALAQEMGWPLFGVFIPPTVDSNGHFFLRWKERGREFNFETNTIIANYATATKEWDKEYRKFFLKKDSFYEKLYGKENLIRIKRNLLNNEILLSHILPPLIAGMLGDTQNVRDDKIIDIVSGLEAGLGSSETESELSYGFSDAYKDIGVAYYNHSLSLARKIRAKQIKADKRGSSNSSNVDEQRETIKQFKMVREGFLEALIYFSLSNISEDLIVKTRENLKTLSFDWGQTLLIKGNDYNNAGVRHSVSGRGEEAVKLYKMALVQYHAALERVDVLPEEVEDYPFFFRVYKSMGTTYQNWGKTLEDQNFYEEAEQKYMEALDSLKMAKNCAVDNKNISPEFVKLYISMGSLYGNWAILIIDKGLSDETVEGIDLMFKKAVDLLERGLSLAPSDKSVISVLDHIKKNYTSFKKMEY